MGGSRTGKRGRRGRKAKGLDTKSVDVGDECHRLALIMFPRKILFSFHTLQFAFLYVLGNIFG